MNTYKNYISLIRDALKIFHEFGDVIIRICQKYSIIIIQIETIKFII